MLTGKIESFGNFQRLKLGEDFGRNSDELDVIFVVFRAGDGFWLVLLDANPGDTMTCITFQEMVIADGKTFHIY